MPLPTQRRFNFSLRKSLGLVGLGTALLCRGASDASPSPPAAANASTNATRHSPAWRLLFSGPSDVTDTWGLLNFGVTPVHRLREIAAPDFAVASGFPLADGRWEVFGQRWTEIQPGPEPWQRLRRWTLVRSTTRDGVTFEPAQTVLEETGHWTDHLAIARHGDTGEYLALKLEVDDSGFAYTAFFSPNGTDWRAHPGNPLFYDGDAMSLFWSPVLHRFVCINKGLQPHRKHFRDHGGTTPALGDDTLRDRRVLMMRSSPDGRRWEPNVSLDDVWNRHRRKGNLPDAFFTVPAADDPPDLEFYSGNAFWYYDRAYMMVLNYAASPLAPGKHGPHLDNEWWTSPDGWRWTRPARGVNALEVFPQVPRLETHPLVLRGQILFPLGAQLLGLPEDRLGYVGARANAEFSTRPFPLPTTPLVLNAAVPAPDRGFAREQAYLMVALLDERGAIVPGCEAEKCVVRQEDRRDIPLRWEGAPSLPRPGSIVRLRVHLRSARLYAVTSAPITP